MRFLDTRAVERLLGPQAISYADSVGPGVPDAASAMLAAHTWQEQVR